MEGRLAHASKRMKWILPILMLAVMCPLACAGIVGGMLPVSGGAASGGRYGIVCGPPMYDYFYGGVCGGNVSILYPADNQSFFFPDITPNITFWVSGYTTPNCFYSVGGLYNNFSCGNGNTSMAVTLPEGNPTTISFLVTETGCANLTSSVDVHVYYRGGYGNEHRYFIIILGLMLLFIPLLPANIKRRRKRRI